MHLYKIGFCRISLVLVAIILLSLTACSQSAPPSKKQTLSSDPVIRWIQQNAIPLRTVNPGSSDADLTPFQKMVGNASIVGLGEATHGTHEFFEIKARLAEYLITRMGFTTFVMENDWGASKLIDAYINGGPGTINSMMRDGLFNIWQTQEFRSLLEWMRAYNADSAHTTKIHFLGMDSEHLSRDDFTAVENYVQQVDPAQAAHVQGLYSPIIAPSLNNPYTTYVALPASTKQQYQNQAQQVFNLLQAHQKAYISHSSSKDFQLALQNARIIVQFTTFINYSNQDELNAHLYQLDTYMAENVAWVHDHYTGSTTKVIVWAHDLHIANDTTYGTQDGRNMGGELRAMYGNGYLPVGTTLYQGSFRTYNYPKTATQQIPTPDQSTYNYDLGQAGLSLYMLNLRAIPPGPVTTWANGPAPLVLYGQDGSDVSSICALNQWFDVIVHVQHSTPSIPI